MNRRKWMTLSGAAFAARGGTAVAQNSPAPAGKTQPPPEILLKDYRPRSIYRIPKTDVPKAKYPAIDVHCHGARPIEKLDEWVKAMDAANIEKAVIFTGANTGPRFEEARKPYSKYPGFSICGAASISRAPISRISAREQ